MTILEEVRTEKSRIAKAMLGDDSPDHMETLTPGEQALAIVLARHMDKIKYSGDGG